MHPSKQGLDDNSFNEVVSVDDEPLLGDSRRDEENESILDALDSSSSGGEIVLIDISSHSQGTKNGGIESTYVDQPQCRICLDTGGDDLIAPCKCKGTQKFVHRSCLDNWRAAKEGFAFSHCTECKTLFHLRANVPSDRRWSRLKFQFLVLRDHAAVFVVVMLVVASLAFLVYKFNGDELREMFGYEQHPYGFYAIAVIVILSVGLLYGFFIAIICGQRINNRHYHILAKQELTKEYIVENLGDEEPSDTLESGHINELKMLGLY